MELRPLLLQLWLALAAFMAGGSTGVLSSERPNFLFIYTDDQRWDALGVVQRELGDKGRFPWFQTPNVDRLAAEGVRFRNAFVVESLCSPSRAAFLTGRYNHVNGVCNNHTPLPLDSVTWASLLRTAGYATGYVGKFHMGHQSGPRPGFDYSASFIWQGKYHNCPFEINGKQQATAGWVDDVSTEFAINFIKEHPKRSFALVVGFKSAHGPFEPPARWANKFAGLPPNSTPNATVPAVYSGKFSLGQPKAKGKKPKAAKVAQSRANMFRGYFGCLGAMDENVGRLLTVLDELKLADNTVVVLTSDNGLYFGEHGVADKRSAYDESLRIPLIVRWPKLGDTGRCKLIDQMVLNIDLAPTFLDLAGVKVPQSMQGRTWRPLLEGNATGSNWRTAFFYEYFFERNFAVPPMLAVRTDLAKLIKYPGHDDWTELFDLANDPYETKNLAGDPSAKNLLVKMEAEFDRQAKAVDFRIPEYADKPPEQQSAK
jgi:arylsulfatase A-like enzyme